MIKSTIAALAATPLLFSGAAFAGPYVNVEAPSEAEENDDVSLDQVSEAEEQVSDNVSDEENNS